MSQYLSKLTPEQAKEVPMVDLAFNVLKAANVPFYYRDLMAEIAKVKGYSDEDVVRLIAQLYTEINVDGRFACVGNNLWGLKRWYPVDNKDGEMSGVKRPRIINDEDDDLEEEEYPEEEETFTADEDFDSFDEDREEVEEEEDELFTPDDADEEEDAEAEELEDLDAEVVDLDEGLDEEDLDEESELEEALDEEDLDDGIED